MAMPTVQPRARLHTLHEQPANVCYEPCIDDQKQAHMPDGAHEEAITYGNLGEGFQNLENYDI